MKRILLSAAIVAAYVVVFAGPAFAGGGCDASSCTTMPIDTTTTIPVTTTTIPATTTTIPTTTSTIPAKPKPAPKPKPPTTTPRKGTGAGGPTTPGTTPSSPAPGTNLTNTVKTLPNTGAYTVWLVALALTLLAVGGLLWLYGRPQDGHLRLARN